MIKSSQKSGSPGTPPEDRGFDDGVAAYYQPLLRALRRPADNSSGPVCSVGLTSCHSREGVTTVASQLATTAAGCEGQKVVVVDANFVRPALHAAFRVRQTPGLAEVVQDAATLSASIQASAVPGLHVLAAGECSGDTARAYQSKRLAEVVDELGKRFDLAVYDIPPANQSSSAIHLAALLDGVLLVVQAEGVRWEVARRAKEVLARTDVRLLGAVLNKRRQHVPSWLYRRL